MPETDFFHLRDGNPHIYCAGYEIINALILFVRIMCHIVTGIVFLSHRAQSKYFLYFLENTVGFFAQCVVE